MSYVIFLELFDWMQFEVSFGKSHNIYLGRVVRKPVNVNPGL